MKRIQNGILLRKIHYSETSLILHFYTLESGFCAYIFKGAKKKKGNMLHVLSLVEITAYFRNDSELGKITEVNSNYPAQQLSFSPVKGTIAFFMGEVLSQILSHSGADKVLYQFLEEEIKWLDISNEISNYPLWFLIKLAEKLGFGIHSFGEGKFFHLTEGEISNQTPINSLSISSQSIEILTQLLQSDRAHFLSLIITKKDRKELLSILLHYYQHHLPSFKPLKSLPVLETVLEN